MNDVIISETRLLIVDDNPHFRDCLVLFAKTLSDLVVVGEALDGREAIDQCERLQPDLILMDLMMPRLSGTEATRIIHERYPSIQIIGMSGFDDEDTRAAIITAGAAACIAKDASFHDFMAQVEQVRARRQSVNPP